MRKLFLLLIVLATNLHAANLFQIPAASSPSTKLIIYGAADYPAISPLLMAFHRKYPNIDIEYTEGNTLKLYQKFLADQPNGPDVMLSSAMDLQFKLVNDGYARPYLSSETERLPHWANWRNEIFGFTYEPAVIVVNRTLLDSADIPRSRSELLTLLRRQNESLRGRIGTFDIERVGIGYLTWANDRQQTTSYGRLLEAFGNSLARQYPSSASMLQSLQDKELTIAYNVLGSYANSWAKVYPDLQVILPEDFTTLVMRSAFISRSARNLESARLFVDFLLSKEGQRILADASNLYPIRDDISGYETITSLIKVDDSRFKPIYLDLSLLAISDQSKKQIILDEWDSAMQSYP
ncbi:ABC transporter substrate-binding protein [Marinobacterium zhoushanense]|uniref:ABC transporter substrate-binding protein n=1 Tax=Marinobacterium zhoushanense TaxID=1679163 RepID=A0ABQ1JZ83_9GAMM|nr:ABC transporter substrate-binding protein [Marinobacterium zhoushanense]GGB79251.1 ABC transporter substrate-binding protein [Marinobacterium zhoushanense]